MSEHTPLTEAAEQAFANTDRELFRDGGGDGNGQSYYEPSIHVTAQGHVGMNVGGTVYTLPIREWHSLAARTSTATADTGLRERVEALRLDVEHSRAVRDEDPTITRRDGMPADVGALLRIILAAATPASTEDERQCGPCERGQHGCCDKGQFMICDCEHGASTEDRADNEGTR